MVAVWDDDERGPHRMPYNEDNSEKEEEYVPIWKILKEYYDEEKERLYIHPPSPPRLGAYNPANYRYSNYGEYDSESEYEPSDDYEDYDSGCDERDECKENTPNEIASDIGDIIEKEIYKKFSYV